MVGPIDGARRQAMTSDRIKCLSEAGVLPAQQAGSKTQNRGLYSALLDDFGKQS